MTKLDHVIEALSALPEGQWDEIADVAIELAELARAQSADAVLTKEQLAEARRRAQSFVPADPARIAKLQTRYR